MHLQHTLEYWETDGDFFGSLFEINRLLSSVETIEKVRKKVNSIKF